MKKIVSTIFLFASALLITAQQPAFITDSLDAYVQREMKRWNIPGVAVAIVKDGNTIISKGYGVTNTDTKQKVDGNTLFMIASNTKIFTGTSIAMLADQGRLSLNDPVVKHLPYFKMYDNALTPMVSVEDLLSHRMGFETFQGDFYNWANNATRKEIIMNMAKNKPVYDFRDTWGYCNAGFVAAGEIIHAVTDTTWEDYISTHFFRPMEMDRSSVTHEKISTDANACTPYTMFQNELVKLNYDNLNNIAPCAAINSCTNDLTHWMLTQLNEGKYKGKTIIPEHVIDETRLPRSIVGDGHSGLFRSQHFDLYGLGIELNDYEGREMVWHTGGADGFVTTVCFIPEEELGIAVLTNTDANYFFLACLYDIIESYFDMPHRNLSSTYYNFFANNTAADNAEIDAWYKAADTYTGNASDLRKFTGTYKSDVYGNMDIQLVNQKLLISFEHHPQLKGVLRPLSENSFVCTYDPISWGVKEIPFTITDGKVVSATVTVNSFIDFGKYEFVKQ